MARRKSLRADASERVHYFAGRAASLAGEAAAIQAAKGGSTPSRRFECETVMHDIVADVRTIDGSRLIFERRIDTGGLPIDVLLPDLQPPDVPMELIEVRGRKARLVTKSPVLCSAIEAVRRFDGWCLLSHG